MLQAAARSLQALGRLGEVFDFAHLVLSMLSTRCLGRACFACFASLREALANFSFEAAKLSVSRTQIGRTAFPASRDFWRRKRWKMLFTRVGTPACAKNNHAMIGMTSISKFAPT
jgi:hypothetical protein